MYFVTFTNQRYGSGMAIAVVIFVLGALTSLAYLIAFLIVLPILWIALLSLEPSKTILSDPLSFRSLSFGNYRDAIAALPLVQMYKNTIIVAVASVTVGAVVSFMASYALTRMVFRRRGAQSTLRFYFLAGLAVPAYVLLFPIYRIDLALGVFGTYAALILPTSRCRSRSTPCCSRASCVNIPPSSRKQRSWTAPACSGFAGRSCCRRCDR